MRSGLPANFCLRACSAASRIRLRWPLRLALVVALACPVALIAQATHGDRAPAQLLVNHHPLWANSANDHGVLAPDRMMPQMTVVLARTAAQEAAFDQLLAAQQDPASPSYHHWLTAAEVGERFGPSPDQVAAVTAWLEAAGLHIGWVAPSRTFIGFTGSAAAVGTAFHTEMHTYTVQGEERYAASSDPQIPAALATVVRAVRGLYTVNERPLDHFSALASPTPETTDGGSHFLAPSDFATIYDLPGGLYGNGQTIGIVGEARVDSADLSNFNNVTNAGVPQPTEIVPTAFGGVDPGPPLTAPPTGSASDGDQGEATLDVLRAGSVAPQASLLLVVATGNSGGVGDDAEYLVQTTPVPAQIMTISFGACESESGAAGVDFWDTLFQQAASEGISVFVSSGDSGASGCDTSFITPPASPAPDSPNVICSSSYATCVGGTEFNDSADPAQYWSTTNNGNLGSALGYIPEGAWNEPLNSKGAPEVAATGGGVSKFIATPSWQTGTGVPSARAGRYTPDVSFSASGHDGYFACFAAGQGSCAPDSSGEYYFVIFSGTSAAAPSMAGIAALLDQQLGTGQGNLNPEIYRLASSNPADFHDVTAASSGVSGCTVNTPSMCNNSIPGTKTLADGQAGFAVTAGYDEATGLGSLDVQQLIDSYSGVKTTPTLSIGTTPAPTAITTAETVIVGITVKGLNTIYPTGTVTIICGSYSVTAAISGQAQIFVPAGALPVGNSTLSASYTPDATAARSYNPATGSIPIVVTKVPIITPSVSLGASLPSLSPAQSLFVAISVSGGAANTPPTGTVTLTSGTYKSTPAAVIGDESQITIPAQALALGTDTLTVTYTPDAAVSSIYSTATGSATVTVTSGPKIAPTVGAMPSTTTLTTAQVLPVLVDVSLAVGYQTPTGTVTLSSGSYTSASVGLTGGITTINIPAGALAIGSDTLTASYTPDSGSSAIYVGASGTASVTVTQAPPPSFAVGNASVALYPGATTGNATNVGVTPAGGFTGSVALTAAITSRPTGAQDLPTLSFGSSSPVSITGTSAGAAQLTITTTAATSGALRTPGRPWLPAGGALLAGLLLFWGPRRRRRWQTLLGSLALLAVFAGSMLACSSVQSNGGGGGGNSNPGTTLGTYTVTVTGVSGTETQTGTVTLTIE